MPDKAVYCPRCQLAFTCNAGNIDQCFCRNISCMRKKYITCLRIIPHACAGNASAISKKK